MLIRFIFAFALLFTTLAHPLAARAELQISEGERVVFAYFKLGDRVPDYRYWASGMNDYTSAKTDDDREDVVFREQFRLDWGFNKYDPKADFLKLRTPIELRLVKKGEATHLEYVLLEILEPTQPFFPYPYGKEHIGLYPKDLSKFKSIPLKAQDLERIQLLFNGKDKYRANLYMVVRPLEANDVSPMIAEDYNVWLLIGDLAYFAIEQDNDKHDVLMSYSAPWYLNKDERQLIDILK